MRWFAFNGDADGICSMVQWGLVHGIEGNTIKIIVTNFKFRSVTQAIGRVASTLQRFTSDEIQFANISLSSGVLYKSSIENPVVFFSKPTCKISWTKSERVVFPDP